MGWPPDDVAPLPEGKRKRAELPKPRPAPYPRQTRRDEAEVLEDSLAPFSPDEAMETGEELLFVRPGVPRQTLRRLRRGHWVVEAQLDLHGLTRSEAAQAVTEFLRRATAQRLGCVRIVHGKGLGVLKAKLRRWLPMKSEVLAFTQAPASQGGGGAILVLLKS